YAFGWRVGGGIARAEWPRGMVQQLALQSNQVSMVETFQNALNGGVSGNYWAHRFPVPNQNGILQNRKVAFHDGKADRFDDFPWSNAVGLPASHLQAVFFVLQENIFAQPLVGDRAPNPNPQFVGVVAAILEDASQRSQRELRDVCTRG